MNILFSDSVDKAGAGDDEALCIICPWLKGLSPETGPWLSALPISDVNAFTDEEGCFDIPEHLEERAYFGIFALDRFRQDSRIFSRLRVRGVRRIINIPSISFFDGQSAETFEALGFSWSEEVEFMRRATAAGLRAAVCAREPARLDGEIESLFDFVLLHDGPRSQFRIGSAQHLPPDCERPERLT